MSSYLPSWATAPSAQVVDVESASSASPVAAAAVPAPVEDIKNFTADEKATLTKVHWILRIAYIVTAVLLTACAAIAIQQSNTTSSTSSTSTTSSTSSTTSSANAFGSSLGTVFIAIYVFMFGVLICCFEVGLSVITRCMSENLGFLYTISGRISFMILVAGMCAKLYTFGYVMIAVIAAVLLLHIILLFQYPKLGPYVYFLHYNAGK